MPSSHISLSGGLLTHQLIEAVQQSTFNQPAAAPESFALPGRAAPSPAELERTIGSAWELLVERWDGIERDLAGMDISTLRDRWIRPLFMLLDFFLEYQRADLVLEDDGRPGGGLRFPISHIGLPTGAEHIRVPVHTVLPGNGNSTASSLDTRREAGSGLRRLAPHDLLQRYLNLSRESKWGILTDGLRLRLLRDYHHTYTRGYVEFDLQGIFTGRDFAAFRALYRLCHASRFLPSMTAAAAAPATAKPAAAKGRREPAIEEEIEEGEGAAYAGEGAAEEGASERGVESTQEVLSPLESFYQNALTTGVKVGEDLRGRVRDAIETFANSFLQATPGLLSRLTGNREPRVENGEVTTLYSPFSVHDFYSDILHTIYRILFLLFAEQRGMFPGRGSLYMDEYSLTALRALAERLFGEDHHVDLWERLKTTFTMVEHGAPGLNIFGYNGALFSASKTPILTPVSHDSQPLLRNDSLLQAIRSLTTVERDNVLQRISYADLSVEEMGSVYESLLDYTPRIATAPETVENRNIAAGMFYLDPRGKARKTSGSYYTHPSLVNELIKSALLPVLEDRLKSAVQSYDADHPERLTPEERDKAEKALLAIKVIDPAAGSGAFLIAADNTLGLRLAQIRTGELYPAEREVRRARRDVLASCLYAVDLNPMAVELCKVSLWINAVVEDERLNFLDHHIKCGNSLVGAFRRLVAQGIPSEAYGGAGSDDKALVKAARNRNDQERRGQLSAFRVTELKSLADLRAWADLNRLAQEDPAQAEQRYRQLQTESEASAERLAFDLWTAAFFWPFEEEVGGKQLDVKAGIQARRGERRSPLPPTTQDVFQALAAPRLVDKGMKEYARKLRDTHHFFHWELEFPEIFNQSGGGGFDVVLGNPPWDLVQDEIEETNSAFERLKNWYKYTDFSILNGRRDLYKLFIVRAVTLPNQNGRLAFLTPIGVFLEEDSSALRKHLFNIGSILSIEHFQNHRKVFFSDVDSRYRFVAFTFTNKQNLPHYFSTVIRLPSEIGNEGWIEVNRANLSNYLGESYSAILFPSKKYFELHTVILTSLSKKRLVEFDVIAEFHASTDKKKGLFAEYKKGDIFWRTLKNGSIHQFDHQFNKPAEYIYPEIVEERCIQKGLDKEIWMHSNRLLFRDIARNDDTRTLICCVAPVGFVSTYDTPMIVPIINKTLSSSDALRFTCGLLNSFVYDFLIRPYVDKHIKQYTLRRLPIVLFDSRSLLHRMIIKQVKKLEESFLEFNNGVPNVTPTIIKARAHLEATIAILTSLSLEQFEFLLSTFSDNANDIHSGIDAKYVAIEEFNNITINNLTLFEREILPKGSDFQEESISLSKSEISSATSRTTTEEHYSPDLDLPQDNQFRTRSNQSKAMTGEANDKTSHPQPLTRKQGNIKNHEQENNTAQQTREQMSFTDYTLYQCETCGKVVLGFDRASHTRDVHKGKEPGYEKKK